MASRRTIIQRCYYEILGVEPTADARTIKSAHRKLALKYHPDRNIGNEDEAAEKFKEVQSAYEVLSSDEDRRWYDLHREDILRGGDDGETEDINLWPFFSPQAYTDFSDNPGGFYEVYNGVFEQIGEFEGSKVPKFGDSTMTYARIKKFYSFFEGFTSRRKFTSEEVYDERAAVNRWQRNQMRKENSKARNSKKRDWENRVQGLAMFVKRRDPRVRKYLVEQEQRKREEEEKMREYEEELNQIMREKQRIQKEEDLQRLRQLMEERPEDFVDADIDRLEFECPACRKTFKSENAYESHCKSKKHLTKVEMLRQQLELEEELITGMTNPSLNESASQAPPSATESVDDTSSFVVVENGDHDNEEITVRDVDAMLAHQMSMAVEDVDDVEYVNVAERIHDVLVGSLPLSSEEDGAEATQEDIDPDHLVALQFQQDDILDAVDGSIPLNDEEELAEPPPPPRNKAERRRKRRNRKRQDSDEEERSQSEDDENGVDQFLQQFRQGKKKKVMTKKEARGDRKRRRRRKEKKTGFDAPAAESAPTNDDSPLQRCRVCNEAFSSKSKLFKHLRDVPEHARQNVKKKW